MERANKYLRFCEPVSETVIQFFCCVKATKMSSWRVLIWSSKTQHTPLASHFCSKLSHALIFSVWWSLLLFFLKKKCFFLFYDCICFSVSGEIARNPVVTRWLVTWVYCLFSLPCLGFIYSGLLYSMWSNIFFILETFFKFLVVLAYVLNILMGALKSWPCVVCRSG